MTYWTAKADLAFIEAFRQDVKDKWALEDEYANWQPSSFRYLGDPPDVRNDDRYNDVRRRIAEDMNRADAIARRLRVGHDLSVILRDQGPMSAPRQAMEDALNRTVGAVRDEVQTERRRIRNPLWWLLYGPFVVLRSAGVNTESVERRWWSRVLVQLGVDIAVGLVAALLLRGLADLVG